MTPHDDGRDPIAALRRLAADQDDDPRHHAGSRARPAPAGGPLRAWEAVRGGRWGTTPVAALGLGLVALLVCAALLLRAHLLAPEPVASDAGQRVAVTSSDAAGGPDPGGDPDGAADAGAADSDGATDPGGEPGAAGGGAPVAGDAVTAAGTTVGGTAAAPAPGGSPSVVHVVGQVRDPGVVEVAAGGRVADAVSAAGGLTEEADASGLNLARAVVDGEQIVVPRPGEVPVPAAVAPGAAESGAVVGGAVGGGGAAAPGSGAGVGLVPLDTASLTELDALPGIGPVLAQRIVDWREEHGGFASVDDLAEVSGIGDAVLEKIRPLVVA